MSPLVSDLDQRHRRQHEREADVDAASGASRCDRTPAGPALPQPDLMRRRSPDRPMTRLRRDRSVADHDNHTSPHSGRATGRRAGRPHQHRRPRIGELRRRRRQRRRRRRTRSASASPRLLAALLFGRILPNAANPARAGWILGALALVTCVVFWSGLPFVLGMGAVYSGGRARRNGADRPRRAGDRARAGRLRDRLSGRAQPASRSTSAAPSRAIRERGTTRSKPAASARSFSSWCTCE